MKHYNYLDRLNAIWSACVNRYKEGRHSVDDILEHGELQFIASIGLKPIDIFDYVEDYAVEMEPGYATFAAICSVRRQYFLEVQQGIPSEAIVKPESLPAKTDALDGVVWLSRIIPKAIGKLKGELDPDIMYCCGGDRNFFRTNDIHPAEFLQIVWKYEDDLSAIVRWVKTRRDAKE
jgi:hypothetical protein